MKLVIFNFHTKVIGKGFLYFRRFIVLNLTWTHTAQNMSSWERFLKRFSVTAAVMVAAFIAPSKKPSA